MPAPRSGACQLVTGADVVVNLFGTHDPSTRSVLSALAEERRPPAIVTEITQPEFQRRTTTGDWWFHLDHVHVATSPLTAASLLAAITTALRQRDEPPPMWGDGFC